MRDGNQLTLAVDREHGNGFFVRIGNRWEEGLTPDEALWTVAQFLNNREPRYLKTDAEHGALKRRFHESREEDSERVPQVHRSESEIPRDEGR